MISRNAVTGLTRSAMMLTLAAAVAGCGILGGKDPKTTPTVGNRSPILSQIESGAVVDPALASVAVVLPPAQVNADWAQVGGTPSKSYGHLALSASPSRVWTSAVEGGSNRRRLAAAPVIGGGAAYVVGTDGRFTRSMRQPARNAGRLKWESIAASKHPRSVAALPMKLVACMPPTA